MSKFPAPASLPVLNIPQSNTTVKVSVINNGTRLGNIPRAMFFEPEIKGHETLRGTANSGAEYLFDGSWEINVGKDVSEVLTEQNIPLKSISSVIWSYWHWDHIGEAHLFPYTTSITVWPGFKHDMVPGYPTNPDSPIPEHAYKDCELVEIAFDKGLMLGQFRPFDYFRDGSFYLLDTPGHVIGHVCGLARTTPETFIFMGGEICHHGGSMRSTNYLPLPEHTHPSPLEPTAALPYSGLRFVEVHPNHSVTEPFYRFIDGGAYADAPESQRSIEKLAGFDGRDNVFTIIAHDQTMLNVLEFFPKSLND